MLNLHQGDCLVHLKECAANTFDSLITDPPYGLSKHSEKDIRKCLAAWLNDEEYEHSSGGFMQHNWDSWVPSPTLWKEVYRVLKPGAYLAVFAGERTQDLMAIALRLAGFEYRHNFQYVYGSGLPKGQDIGKMIDRQKGLTREVLGRDMVAYRPNAEKAHKDGQVGEFGLKGDGSGLITKPASPEAEQWSGYSSQVKPSYEPILIFQKPISETTIASNCIKWGVGAMNIDVSRIPVDMTIDDARLGGNGTWGTGKMAKQVYAGGYAGETVGSSSLGRYPSNFIHDGSPEVTALFPANAGAYAPVKGSEESDPAKNVYGTYGRVKGAFHNDNGSASRFFYTAKVKEKERQLYLPDGVKNNHPTLKPLDLLEYLIKLLTPPNGVVLDPFMGSGSCGIACSTHGYSYAGMELQPEYFALAELRVTAAYKEKAKNAVTS